MLKTAGTDFCVLQEVEESPELLTDRESDGASIERNRRAAKDSRAPTAPQLRCGFARELPDTLTRASCRNIQKVFRTQSRGGSRAGGKGNSSRSRYIRGCKGISDPQTPECFLWSSKRGNKAPAVGAGRQGSVAVQARSQPVGNAALDIHAVKPRPRTIGIASEVQQGAPIQQDRINYAAIVRGDPFRSSAGWRDAPNIQFVRQGTLDKIDE